MLKEISKQSMKFEIHEDIWKKNTLPKGQNILKVFENIHKFYSPFLYMRKLYFLKDFTGPMPILFIMFKSNTLPHSKKAHFECTSEY